MRNELNKEKNHKNIGKFSISSELENQSPEECEIFMEDKNQSQE